MGEKLQPPKQFSTKSTKKISDLVSIWGTNNFANYIIKKFEKTKAHKHKFFTKLNFKNYLS